MPQDGLLADMTTVDISPLAEHLQEMRPLFDAVVAFREVAYPLKARILVCEADGTGLVVITADALAILRPAAHALREWIAGDTGVPSANVLICASHSHSAPVLALTPESQSWTSWVMARVSDAAAAAWRKRRPARAGVGYGYQFAASFNRRLPQADGRVKFVRNYAEGRMNPRPIDPRVGVLRIDEASGKLMGAMVHFAAHPATLIDPPTVTPDYPGFISSYVEQRRSGAHVGFFQGACGDMLASHMFTTLGAAQYDGSLLGKEVDRVLDDVVTTRQCPLRVIRKEHRLPLEKMPSEEEITAWERGCDEFLEHSQADPTRLWVNGLNMPEYVSADTRRAMVQKLRDWCDWVREHREEIARVGDVAYELVAVRLGELTAVFHPFEAFVQIGLEVQRLSPCRHTWLVGYANGAMAYLPTAEEYRRGGYEPNNRRYAMDLEHLPLNYAEHADSVFIRHALSAVGETLPGG